MEKAKKQCNLQPQELPKYEKVSGIVPEVAMNPNVGS
jgi:hypothetical protein